MQREAEQTVAVLGVNPLTVQKVLKCRWVHMGHPDLLEGVVPGTGLPQEGLDVVTPQSLHRFKEIRVALA